MYWFVTGSKDDLFSLLETLVYWEVFKHSHVYLQSVSVRFLCVSVELCPQYYWLFNFACVFH